MNGKIKKSSIYFDTLPTKNSNNAVTSDGIARAIENGSGSITIDSALSTNSENAVQNKVITNEINNINDVIPTTATSQNKLATIADIPTVPALTIDSALSTTSENAVQNKVITNEINSINDVIPTNATSQNKLATIADIPTVPTLTIDSALSTTSENAVQNKVIASEINSINGSIATHSTQLTTLSNNINQNTTNIGTLANLTTTDKSSLVGAINEIASSGGSSGHEIGTLHDYFASNQTTTGTVTSGGISYISYSKNVLINLVKNNDTNYDGVSTITVIGVLLARPVGQSVTENCFLTESQSTGNFIVTDGSSAQTFSIHVIWKYQN